MFNKVKFSGGSWYRVPPCSPLVLGALRGSMTHRTVGKGTGRYLDLQRLFVPAKKTPSHTESSLFILDLQSKGFFSRLLDGCWLAGQQILDCLLDRTRRLLTRTLSGRDSRARGVSVGGAPPRRAARGQ
eukprot:768661-Hanusia_phi.AAC.1